MIVFGSDYRTAAGHVEPGRSAQQLLEAGPAAIAIAPANYRSNRDPQLAKIGVLASPGDDSALQTARGLAERLGATVTTGPTTPSCWWLDRGPRLLRVES